MKVSHNTLATIMGACKVILAMHELPMLLRDIEHEGLSAKCVCRSSLQQTYCSATVLQTCMYCTTRLQKLFFFSSRRTRPCGIAMRFWYKWLKTYKRRALAALGMFLHHYIWLKPIKPVQKLCIPLGKYLSGCILSHLVNTFTRHVVLCNTS